MFFGLHPAAQAFNIVLMPSSGHPVLCSPQGEVWSEVTGPCGFDYTQLCQGTGNYSVVLPTVSVRQTVLCVQMQNSMSVAINNPLICFSSALGNTFMLILSIKGLRPCLSMQNWPV